MGRVGAQFLKALSRLSLNRRPKLGRRLLRHTKSSYILKVTEVSVRLPRVTYSISLGMWKRGKALSIASATSKKDLREASPHVEFAV
jgi:hypothetical protein